MSERTIAVSLVRFSEQLLVCRLALKPFEILKSGTVDADIVEEAAEPDEEEDEAVEQALM